METTTVALLGQSGRLARVAELQPAAARGSGSSGGGGGTVMPVLSKQRGDMTSSI